MTTAQKMKVVFHGNEETLDIIDIEGPLVEYLSSEGSSCPFLGNAIVFIKILGMGTYGTVFSIKIPSIGTKEYVAKVKQKDMIIIDKVPFDMTLKYLADFWYTNYGIEKDATIKTNGGNPDRMLEQNDTVNFPLFAENCERSGFRRRAHNGEMVIIPEGSYVCPQEQYLEYVTALLAAELYKKGRSIHFMDIFGFATCLGQKTKQYIFMEKIDTTLNEIKICVSPVHLIAFVLFVQIVHAIGMLQHYFSMVHGDLHNENIMFENVTQKTKFNGEYLHDADYYHYRIGETNLYLPALPVIPKLGDFGIAVKWKPPMIGNGSVVNGKFPVPDWYSKTYDVMMVAREFFTSAPENKYFIDLLAWVYDMEPVSYLVRHKLRSGFKKGRPDLKKMKSMKKATPRGILTNKKLMKEFTVKPEDGKIVTLGVLP